MKQFLDHKATYISIAIIVIVIVGLMINGVSNRDNVEITTTVVERGIVRELVSVSGIAKAEQVANLAFPASGLVREVKVKVGDSVQAGDVLATIDVSSLWADRKDALGSLAQAKANLDELLKGPTTYSRNVTEETLINAEEALKTTKLSETQKVKNAYRSLLSSGLTAYSEDIKEDAIPPTVSGTYTCDMEGTYQLEIFSSKADSGYSYRLTGLETGTYSVATNQPGALGVCGLLILFDPSSNYNNSKWKIDVPNIRSDSYVINRNAYSLAVTQSETAITLAEQSLALAKANADNQNAPARSEAVLRANAIVSQAEARLNRVDATIADRTLTSPFSGVITKVDILPGETVTTIPVITLLSSNEFEVIARVPEIDIGKLSVGQIALMMFDAKSDETIRGDISFISPEATKIDGVAYYEATIQFRDLPDWIRSGLNTDVEIIVKEETAGLRVPKRFVTKTENGYEVLTRATKEGAWASTTIEVTLEGNDGYYAITGLDEGTILATP
ncbi:HlyD family efflux transporter periplasmic adaptor subunit [Candidatus Kaiserbacteria bacterium]|nr:HlyD family efflux transporter periplasmic adaptor subunit [Candidatus Kaiserbacteria bacterium]USN92376.1 MAG: HlyD family efflux transporter periplasmic adaptor subunit [Candidatus Nomurabacteria bacterium]